MTTNHGYSLLNLRADYFRAFVGIVICLAPFALGAKAVGGVLILMGCAVLFALYGLRTISRQMTQVVLDESKIAMKSLRARTIPWEKLSDLSLSYFSTWRSGGKGWMQLRLRGAGQTMRIESNIADFEYVVQCAVTAAQKNKLELNNTTLRNIDALSLDGVGVRQAA